MTIHLEKDLKIASGNRRQKGGSSWITVKLQKEGYLKSDCKF